MNHLEQIRKENKDIKALHATRRQRTLVRLENCSLPNPRLELHWFHAALCHALHAELKHLAKFALTCLSSLSSLSSTLLSFTFVFLCSTFFSYLLSFVQVFDQRSRWLANAIGEDSLVNKKKGTHVSREENNRKHPQTLELCASVSQELFHVRWQDVSQQPLLVTAHQAFLQAVWWSLPKCVFLSLTLT